MKKYLTTPEYKAYNKRHAALSLLRRTALNKYKKETRKALQGLDKIDRKIAIGKLTSHKGFKYITAPANFSFLNNPDGTINFINLLQSLHDKRKKVFVVMKDVEELTYDAIVVLLSIMFQFKSHKIDFNGDFPRNPEIKEKLENSGFLPNLYETLKIQDEYKINKPNSIFKAMKKVDSALAAKVLEQVGHTIWDAPRKYKGPYRTLIELMLNTHNHASVDTQGGKHWWLSINHNKKQKYVSFSFVDYGVGVFTSLNNKTSNSQFFNWLSRLSREYKLGDNAELLKLILNGDLHRIATKHKNYRGKGLPSIKQALHRNQISNLYMVTENVFANVSKDNYILLDNNFSGTFIYWEINKENECCNGSIKN